LLLLFDRRSSCSATSRRQTPTHTLVKLSVSSTCHATYMAYCNGDHSLCKTSRAFPMRICLQPQGLFYMLTPPLRFAHATDHRPRDRSREQVLTHKSGVSSQPFVSTPLSRAYQWCLPTILSLNSYNSACKANILPSVRPACQLGFGTSVRYM
jgi:hypothetical protein